MIKYTEVSKDTFDLLFKTRASLQKSPLDAQLRILAELKVSQINGCPYCCRLHAEEARKLGMPQEKLDLLSAWRNSHVFTPEEKLVLQWVEAVTHLEKDLQTIKNELGKMFSERQIVDLTATIAIMGAINRAEISLTD